MTTHNIIDDQKYIATFQEKLDHLIQLKVEYIEKYNILRDCVTQKEIFTLSLEINQLDSNICQEISIFKNMLKLQIQEKCPTETQRRIAETQYKIWLGKLSEFIIEYSNEQNKQREWIKKRNAIQLKVVNSNTTDIPEEVNIQVFAQEILPLQEFEQRHQEITNLEKNIRVLSNLFLDVAVLIEEQGTMIDSIEVDVSSAQENVAEAKVELTEAVKYQKRSRKNVCLCLCCIAAIILVIVIPLVVRFG